MKTLEVKDLLIRLGEIQISANFKVAPGECLILRGPSGCGKSTLLRAMAGFADGPVTGRVTGDELAPEKRGIGWMAQSPVFLPGMSVRESLEFPLRVRGRGDTQVQAEDWLKRLGLSAHADAKPTTLSGGERQRLSLGRALIFGPSFALLDEPFSALDGDNRRRMLGLLEELGVGAPPLVISLHDGLANELRNNRVSELGCRISEDGTQRNFKLV